MIFLEILFWLLALLVAYTYVGYGVVIAALAFIKQKINPEKPFNEAFEPAVTLIVAAYNEEEWIKEKAKNMLELDYPQEKMQILFVTDGSDDNTPEILKEYDQFTLLHKPERAGKIAAMERAVTFAENPILIFSDANALLNKEAVKNIVRHYNDPEIGAVAGEKRIIVAKNDSASGAGEGFYWKYESFLKKMDYKFYSVVGAAGELFSVRRDLYEPVHKNAILDDFMISLTINEKGYRVAYEPDAYASELPSESVEAEWTRKTRIAAGGIQSILWLKSLLNPFKHGRLTFQYVSHRVLRWTLVPVSIIFLFVLNLFLIGHKPIYDLLIIFQLFIFFLGFAGYLLENKKIRFKLFFIPYYVLMMNLAVFVGFKRFISGKQTVLWAKAKRAKQ